MKAVIDKEGCIMCGLCAEMCPEVFQIGADGRAETVVDTIPKELEDAAAEAAAECPVEVIGIEH